MAASKRSNPAARPAARAAIADSLAADSLAAATAASAAAEAKAGRSSATVKPAPGRNVFGQFVAKAAKALGMSKAASAVEKSSK